MSKIKKVKNWITRNKKYIIMGSTVIFSIIGVSVSYVIYKHNKISFPNWLKLASKQELEEIYEKMRLEYCKTGIEQSGMDQIGRELEIRGAKEWFEKHPPNKDPNFRWTDANRWDKD